MTTFENEQGWQLEYLRVDYQLYGEFKGKYIGKITFQNKNSDAFTFRLSAEKTQQYIGLLKDEIVSSAGTLGQKLLQSLSLLPLAASKSIEEIPHENV